MSLFRWNTVAKIFTEFQFVIQGRVNDIVSIFDRLRSWYLHTFIDYHCVTMAHWANERRQQWATDLMADCLIDWLTHILAHTLGITRSPTEMLWLTISHSPKLSITHAHCIIYFLLGIESMRMSDLFTDHLFVWFIHWLIDWVNEWVNVWVNGWMTWWSDCVEWRRPEIMSPCNGNSIIANYQLGPSISSQLSVSNWLVDWLREWVGGWVSIGVVSLSKSELT